MKPFVSKLAVVVLVGVMSGCAPAPHSGKGFTLPDGDVEQGQAAFVEHKCHACHDVSGVELPEITGELDPKIELGGKVTRISTYGELVTSVINPSHKLASGYPKDQVAVEGESKMTNYNEALTVQEVIDIVAFLQSHYELKPYDPTQYPILY